MFKKSTTKQSKAILALSVALIALIAFTSAITFAYFTSSTGTKDSSELTFGELALTLDNATTGDKLTVTNDHGILVPGCSVTLAGSVKLNSTINSVVKFSLTAKATKDNQTLTLPTNNGFTDKIKAVLTGFVEHGGAYYGFMEAKTNAAIADLSKISLTFPVDEVGNDWQGAKVVITLEVTAVQADHILANNENVAEVNATNVTTIAAANVWSMNKGTGLPTQP